MSMPKIRPPVNLKRLPLPTTREDYPKKILKDSSKKLKNSKLKMKLLRKKWNPKTLWKITFIQSKTP